MGHKQTRMQPEFGAIVVCTGCSLDNWDSLLNIVLLPLLDMRGGASLCKPLEILRGFGVATVIGV